jgi:phosphocarrier protein
MPERRIAVASPDGLHARPAALFVKAAAASGIPVRIAKSGGTAPIDGRSILAVLGLDVRQGDEVVISAEGDGADEALDRLAAMLGADGADAAA